VKVRRLSSGGIALHECALAGKELSLSRGWLAGADLKKGRLADMLPDCEGTPTDFNTAAWLTFRANKRMPRKACVFVDYRTKEFKDNLPWRR